MGRDVNTDELVYYGPSDELAHYGKLGMKWGVLRSQAGAGSRGAQRKLDRADRSWEKELHSTKGFIKINNRMADHMNGPGGAIAKHNSNPKWAGKNLNENPKLSAEYFAAFNKVSTKVYIQAVKDVYGESPSGKFTTTVDKSTGNISVTSAELSHGFEEGVFVFHVDFDDLGLVTSFDMTDGALAHSGVKGMRWGVRRARSSSTAGSTSTHRTIGGPNLTLAVQRKIIGKVQAHRSLREKQASTEHKTARVLKKKHLSALSNDEIKQLTTRLQLEKQYKDLHVTPASKGVKITTSIVQNVGTQVVSKIAKDAAMAGIETALGSKGLSLPTPSSKK